MTRTLLARHEVETAVTQAINAQAVWDMHTHLYPPSFGTPMTGTASGADADGLMLWGVDELVTYHYLVAELYRVLPTAKLPYEAFWRMTKPAQADLIWKTLFVDRTPLSEACRGVLTTLQRLGLDPNETTLAPYRKFFAQQNPSDYIDRVMQLANVSAITMTNPVFDDNERNRWLKNPSVGSDSRFRAVLRIDPLLRDFPAAAKKLNEWGYAISDVSSPGTIESARKFLRDWIGRQKAIYLAVSLPPEFRYPADPANAVAAAGQTMLEQVVLPVCAEQRLPFAMMIGSRLRVNPALRDAGDMVGTADVESVVNLCQRFPQNKFFVTMLARENQHQLCVAARKFGNLMVFGCWWFLNNPSLIEELTRMRIELLGTSFIPQHSDARILDQLIYKWHHSRQLIAGVLADKYSGLIDSGRHITTTDIQRDAKAFFHDNFASFLTR
jgi:hypothetical protein